MNLSVFTNFLNQIYLNAAYLSEGITDYCPNGLQIEGKKEIKSIATAVSASLYTIEEAVNRKVDALVVHHGLFWNGDPYIITGVKKEKIRLLIENGISLFAYHLPMDYHRQLGNNWKAALDMGWINLRPFGKFGKSYLGVCGEIPENFEKNFEEALGAYYKHVPIACQIDQRPIRTAALVSGGAHKCIKEAIEEKMDAFITGSYDEWVWNEVMDAGCTSFFAVGHSNSERIGPKALSEFIQKECSLPCSFIDQFNPF